MSQWVRPVTAPHVVTGDAASHLRRSILCGIDYISNTDKKLRAMSYGKIVYVHRDYNHDKATDISSYDALGMFVVARHEIGDMPVWVRYCHNSKVLETSNKELVPGWIIGEYGNTGYSFGDHVHVDFWAMFDDLKKLEEYGVHHCTMRVLPWPGAPTMLTNVDPTKFLVEQFAKEN